MHSLLFVILRLEFVVFFTQNTLLLSTLSKQTRLNDLKLIHDHTNIFKQMIENKIKAVGKAFC